MKMVSLRLVLPVLILVIALQVFADGEQESRPSYSHDESGHVLQHLLSSQEREQISQEREQISQEREQTSQERDSLDAEAAYAPRSSAEVDDIRLLDGSIENPMDQDTEKRIKREAEHIRFHPRKFSYNY